MNAITTISATVLDRRKGRVFLVCSLLFLFAGSAARGEAKSVDEVRKLVDAAIVSGEYDNSLIAAIGKLPYDDLVSMAKKLLESPNARMRRQGILKLANLPPEKIGGTMRKLLNDGDSTNQNMAALYLARKANDADARAILLKNALGREPVRAADAVSKLGQLKGADIGELLLKLLTDEKTGNVVRFAVITAAGRARAKECAPALVELLDSPELCARHRGDTTRVRDTAAQALERMYRINYVGIRNVYFAGPVEKREEAIAVWKKWWAEQGERPDPRPRKTYLAKLLDECFKTLRESPGEEERERVRNLLRGAMGGDLCLGDLPGVDAIAIPSIKDLWKIMQVSDEGRMDRPLHNWRGLWGPYIHRFLPAQRALDSDPDLQALAFIGLAEGIAPLHRITVWSLCRNFAEAFPHSELLQDVNTIKTRLEREFREKNKKVVIHGHIAVLEPIPRPVDPNPSMVPSEHGALYDDLDQHPSGWQAYRLMADYYRRKGIARDTNSLFVQLIKRYPGNEWPFLGRAIHQLRVAGKPERALEFADKALILNPGNAKVYAVRGMIRVVSELSPDDALKDLTRAFELDPKSLGDEPETLEAVCFLVEKVLKSSDKAAARIYLEALGELKAFRATRPVKESAEYKKLSERIR